jgi:hypothetical protein
MIAALACTTIFHSSTSRFARFKFFVDSYSIFEIEYDRIGRQRLGFLHCPLV